MEHNPLRGLFGVSSPRPVEQRVAPQPIEPTENVYFEIPSGMCHTLASSCIRVLHHVYFSQQKLEMGMIEPPTPSETN